MAGEDIAAGETGHLHVVGVFRDGKGHRCHDHGRGGVLHETAKKITTVASTGESSGKVNNIPAGYAAAPAASADENVLVKLLG
ncbi:MAG: capsid cement protein [Faecalibacterium prausnitzii]